MAAVDVLLAAAAANPGAVLVGGFLIALYLSVTSRSLPKFGNFTIAGVVFLAAATFYVFQTEGLPGIYDKIAFWGFGLVLSTYVLKKLDLFKGKG